MEYKPRYISDKDYDRLINDEQLTGLPFGTERQLAAANAYVEAYEKYGKEEAERIFFEKMRKDESKSTEPNC